jgi:hypothetical protein
MGKVHTDFLGASRLLVRDWWRRIDLKFDEAQREFEGTWKSVYEEFGSRPQDAEVASAKMINGQPLATALTLAMARTDSAEVFGRFKRYLESIMVTTERLSGYPAVRGIPHVQAGFLYMTASVMALQWEAWGIFEKLLTSKLEWYYQSGRAIFSYPFYIFFFFHSEAFGRNATKIHDFFRKELAEPDVAEATSLRGDRITDAYIQAQMLMSLKAAQLNENGETVRIWPDFGRFYGDRIIRLLDRTYGDPEFGLGLLRAFGEDRQTFFSQLNKRLEFVRSNFFRGSPYIYESLNSWEPRETHA